MVKDEIKIPDNKSTTPTKIQPGDIVTFTGSEKELSEFDKNIANYILKHELCVVRANENYCTFIIPTDKNMFEWHILRTLLTITQNRAEDYL